MYTRGVFFFVYSAFARPHVVCFWGLVWDFFCGAKFMTTDLTWLDRGREKRDRASKKGHIGNCCSSFSSTSSFLHPLLFFPSTSLCIRRHSCPSIFFSLSTESPHPLFCSVLLALFVCWLCLSTCRYWTLRISLETKLGGPRERQRYPSVRPSVYLFVVHDTVSNFAIYEKNTEFVAFLSVEPSFPYLEHKQRRWNERTDGSLLIRLLLLLSPFTPCFFGF